MAFSAKAGVFALNTVPGNQSITELGFQPKVVIFLPTNLTADGIGADAYFNLGAAISSAARWALSATSEDGQATTDTQVESYNLCLAQNNPGSSSADYTADYVSNDVDGFTINITNAPSSAVRVGFLAIGGTDLTNVAVGLFQADNGVGEQSVPGIGFPPDAVLFATQSTAHPGGTGGVRNSLGFAVSATERAVIGMQDRNGVATSNTVRHQRTDKCILILDSLGAILSEGDYVSSEDDGFIVDWTVANAQYIFYVAFQGGEYAVGDLTTQTGTGEFSESDVGFQPVAGMFASWCRAASASIQDDWKHSLGLATSPSERFVAGAVSEDDQATSDCDSYQDDGLIYQNYDYAQSLLGSIDLVSWGSDGFMLDQVDADPIANQMLYFVMGLVGEPPDVFPPVPGTVHRQRRFPQVRM